MPDPMVAKETFGTMIGGQWVVVQKGDILADDHPVVRNFGSTMFEPANVYTQRHTTLVVGGGPERASAAPGEQRPVVPPPVAARAEAKPADVKEQPGETSPHRTRRS